MNSSWSLAQKTPPEPFGARRLHLFSTVAFLGFRDKIVVPLSPGLLLPLWPPPFQPSWHLLLTTQRMSLLGRITICPGSWERAQLLAASAESSCSYSDLRHKVTVGWQHRPQQHLRLGIKMASHEVEIDLNEGTGPAGFLMHNSTPRTLFHGRAKHNKVRRYYTDWKALNTVLENKRDPCCYRIYVSSDVTHIERQWENTAKQKKKKNPHITLWETAYKCYWNSKRKLSEWIYQGEKALGEAELEQGPTGNRFAHQRRTQEPLVLECNWPGFWN